MKHFLAWCTPLAPAPTSMCRFLVQSRAPEHESNQSDGSDVCHCQNAPAEIACSFFCLEARCFGRVHLSLSWFLSGRVPPALSTFFFLALNTRPMFSSAELFQADIEVLTFEVENLRYSGALTLKEFCEFFLSTERIWAYTQPASNNKKKKAECIRVTACWLATTEEHHAIYITKCSRRVGCTATSLKSRTWSHSKTFCRSCTPVEPGKTERQLPQDIQPIVRTWKVPPAGGPLRLSFAVNYAKSPPLPHLITYRLLFFQG